MTDEKDRPSTLRKAPHFSKALLLKSRITHCEHFIYDQNLWFEMRSDRERESNIHARRISFHRRVEEFFNFRERHNLIELLDNLGARHSKDRAVKKDVLSS